MQESLIPINAAIVDSLKLRIQLSECEIIAPELTSTTAVYYHDTNTIDDEILPPKPYTIYIDGVTFRFHITQIPIYDEKTEQRIPTKFIEIVLTSKLLRERYFEGITKNTLKHFYKEFMSYKIFKCEYETFINSQVSDIDICINRYVQDINIWQEIISEIYIQSGTKQRFARKIIDSTNCGLQYNNRNSAKPSLPFIKFYHKELELHSKSAEFFNTYLFPKFAKSIKGLVRVEATIKNSRHKQRLYKYNILPKFKTLIELINIGSNALKEFVCFSLLSYIEKQIRSKAPHLSPTDHLIFEFMQSLVLKGYSFKELLNHIQTFIGSSEQATANAKTRMKKRITELFDLLIHKDLKIQSQANHNAHVKLYLEFLGLT